MRGFTLPELLLVLVIAGTLLSAGLSGTRALREAAALRSAARRVVATLSLARRTAVNRREIVRVRADPAAVSLTDAAGGVIVRLGLDGVDRLPVDSVRVRPATMRFNERGHAAPGSVYLYRGNRSIRIVSNFLGRLRVEPVRRIP